MTHSLSKKFWRLSLGECALVVVALLLAPRDAHAWGPAAHLYWGMNALANLAALTPFVRRLLAAYADDFLYGTVAADVVVGKNLATYDLHCHAWKNGFRVLDQAWTERQKAFALGYLAHLASDTIAHNFFVPYKLVESYPTASLRHLYWEVRFDHLVHEVEPGVSVAWKRIARHASRTHDDLLQSTIVTTLFSYGTSKKLFQSGMLVQRLARWKQLVGTLARKSAYALDADEFRHLEGLTNAAVFGLLIDLESSRATIADPAGLRALRAASRMRKDLKRLNGRFTPEAFSRIAARAKDAFREGIYGDLKPPAFDDQGALLAP